MLMLEVTVWHGTTQTWTGLVRYPLQLGRQVSPAEDLFHLTDVGGGYRLAVASPNEPTVSRQAVSVTILDDGSIQVCNLRINSILLVEEMKSNTLLELVDQATFPPNAEVVIRLTPVLRLHLVASFPATAGTGFYETEGDSLGERCFPGSPLPPLSGHAGHPLSVPQAKAEQPENSVGAIPSLGSPQGRGDWGHPPAGGFLSAVFSSLSTNVRGLGSKVKSFISQDQNRLDNVHFAAFAPGQVAAGSQFVLSVWAYLVKHQSEVLERASHGGRFREVGSRGPIRIERGTDLTLHLLVDGLNAAEPTVVMHWADEAANCQFRVTVPESFEPGSYPGEIRVFSRAVQLTCIYFDLEVLESGCSALGIGQARNLQSTQKRVKSVFASYSHEDSIAVMQWARGAGSVGVNVFLDTLSLHAGSDWQSRLATAIEKCDLFCLFWSEASSKSEWVEREWRYALEKRGCRYIQPVPLVDPAKVRPPAELANCTHFEDVARIVIEYQKLTQ